MLLLSCCFIKGDRLSEGVCRSSKGEERKAVSILEYLIRHLAITENFMFWFCNGRK